jgi:ribosomal protein S18 acetylase RimI-like enzyme
MIAYSTLPRTQEEGLRRFEIHRDLPQLADLIEIAFEEELDRTGNRIVQEMRQMAHAWPVWRLMGASSPFSQLMSGYVWIEKAQLVGNATLSLDNRRRRLWSISNVAVHPSYRGRGIAGQLVEATTQEAIARGAQWITLEVRADNLAAQRLYRDLGFQVYDSIAELRLPAHRQPARSAPPALPLRKRLPDDWHGLYSLFKATTPLEAQELRPVLAQHYRMGFYRRLGRWLDDWLRFRRRSEWVLEGNGEIVAYLEAMAQRTRSTHSLQITVHPSKRGALEDALLAAGLQWLSHSPGYDIESKVSASHPQAQQSFRQAGFETVRVLDQMRLDLRPNRRDSSI